MTVTKLLKDKYLLKQSLNLCDFFLCVFDNVDKQVHILFAYLTPRS